MTNDRMISGGRTNEVMSPITAGNNKRIEIKTEIEESRNKRTQRYIVPTEATKPNNNEIRWYDLLEFFIDFLHLVSCSALIRYIYIILPKMLHQLL